MLIPRKFSSSFEEILGSSKVGVCLRGGAVDYDFVYGLRSSSVFRLRLRLRLRLPSSSLVSVFGL